MNIINKIASFISIFLLVAFGGSFYYNQTSVCHNSQEYDIGFVDDHFNLSKEGFMKVAREAEEVWEKSLAKNLFNFKSGVKFKINLVYDERQASTVAAHESKEGLDISLSSYEFLKSRYKSLLTDYERDLQSYNDRKSNFQKRLNDYNNKVAKYNRQGGVPPSEYKDLQDEKKYLESQEKQLDVMRTTVNDKAQELNNLGDQVNAFAGELNLDITVHNQRFGEPRVFDQGDYFNNEINIYQFENFSDLRLVIAHELGHAMGLDHVENPKSIMYYLMDEQDLVNPKLSTEDVIAFKRFCEFRIPKLQEIF